MYTNAINSEIDVNDKDPLNVGLESEIYRKSHMFVSCTAKFSKAYYFILHVQCVIVDVRVGDSTFCCGVTRKVVGYEELLLIGRTGKSK